MQIISKILAEAGESFGTENSSATSTVELTRIANALERIATTLEKLTGITSDNKVAIQPAQTLASQPITSNALQRFSQPKQPIENFTQPVRSQPVRAALPKVIPIIEKTNPKECDTKSPLQEAKISATKPIPKYGLLEDYLNQHGIFIQESREQKPSPEQEKKLTQIALFLGKNFTDCQKLYKCLKSKITAPETSFDFSLMGATSNQNQKIQEFCRLLKGAEILKENNYTGKPEYKFQLKLTGNEHKFLIGAWLENYIKSEVERVIYLLYPQKDYFGYKTLPNSNIKFENGKKSELDLLFTVGGKVFCIEAKTRPSLKDLKDFTHRIEPLKMNNQNLLIVTTEKTDKECDKLTQLIGGPKVVGLENFEEALTAMIKAACEKPQKKIVFG